MQPLYVLKCAVGDSGDIIYHRFLIQSVSWPSFKCFDHLSNTAISIGAWLTIQLRNQILPRTVSV